MKIVAAVILTILALTCHCVAGMAMTGTCGCEPTDKPVCGQNYLTYPNACTMRCVGVRAKHRGPCGGGGALACGCSPIDEPVCSNHYVTYNNQCLLRCDENYDDNYILWQGRCDNPPQLTISDQAPLVTPLYNNPQPQYG